MHISSAEDYRAAKLKIEKDLDDWAKVSWGVFIGVVVAAIFLGEWSDYNRFGDTIPKDGVRVATVLAALLFGAYKWRSRQLYTQLQKAWTQYLEQLNAEEQESAKRESYK